MIGGLSFKAQLYTLESNPSGPWFLYQGWKEIDDGKLLSHIENTNDVLLLVLDSKGDGYGCELPLSLSVEFVQAVRKIPPKGFGGIASDFYARAKAYCEATEDRRKATVKTLTSK